MFIGTQGYLASQCDQIGLFLKEQDNKFSYKRKPKNDLPFWAILKNMKDYGKLFWLLFGAT